MALYTSHFLLELDTHFSLLRISKSSEESACFSVFSRYLSEELF